jgi:hypothetical protein
MATPIQFDLNTALCDWREKLRQSPHFRAENLDELESHLRDSVTVLQTKGLTADEAFTIGIRRVGEPGALEGQFAAENGGRGWRDNLLRLAHKFKNPALHFLIILYFTFGCWLLWGCLKVSQMTGPAAARVSKLTGTVYLGAPAFTRLFWTLMPYWFVPPMVAAIYCGIVWTRKNRNASWFAFFSVTTAILFILLIPVLIAMELPIIDFLNSIPAKTFDVTH